MGELEAPRVGLAYLVSQVGAHAADDFARRLQSLGLTVQHVGILRILATKPEHLTQRALADHLGAHPSRLVLLLDELEDAGLVSRVPDPNDRRCKHLVATKAGLAKFRRVESVTQRLEADMFAGLSRDECVHLASLLRRVASDVGLVTGVHPAYRRLTKGE